ncbi:MAG TPA: cysteine synthase family protein [Vicinamibacteria bacterium]|nr:cysteine synthase family protein [Vicinamibacteria bacterium]
MSRVLPAVPVLESILDAIGHTPLLRVRLAGVPAGVEVWAKCEWFNPGGSVKDRTALSLVTEGEKSGALRPGKVVVDSSSGNTAVGLALVGRAKGYPVELYMPESVNAERQALCRAYGATLVFTDPLLGSDGALEEVRRRVAADPDRYFYADQYRNPANPLAHYRTTGPEIWDQTAGRVTHFVAGLGTTGTIVGTARFLHEKSRRVRVVAVEPDHEMHGLEGLKHLPSAIVPEIYDAAAHDDKVTVSTESAYAMCAEVLNDQGLLVGHSAGAALWAAREIARGATAATIVALLADGGERYLGAMASR